MATLLSHLIIARAGVAGGIAYWAYTNTNPETGEFGFRMMAYLVGVYLSFALRRVYQPVGTVMHTTNLKLVAPTEQPTTPRRAFVNCGRAVAHVRG